MALRSITCAVAAGSVAGQAGSVAGQKWDMHPMTLPENLPSYYLTKDNRTVNMFWKHARNSGRTEESLHDFHACESARSAKGVMLRRDLCSKCYGKDGRNAQGWYGGNTAVFCSVDGTKMYRQWYDDAECRHPTTRVADWDYDRNGEKDVARSEEDSDNWCEEPKAKYECAATRSGPCTYHHWVKEVDSGHYYSMGCQEYSDCLPPAPANPPPAPAPVPTPWVQRALVADEGNDLKSLNSATPDNCKVECEADTACHSFSFSHSKRRCHLKDKCVTASDATDHNPGHIGYVTHYKTCKQDEVLV